ncbi:dynein heavy chain [Marasmius sp. AFHP31]|nr:dynein heavy chain [Marasmius sp. AFHP31]
MARSSLQSQSLDQVLKAERPNTDWKRTDLMKIQGEFRLRLRTLEKLLLQALNELQGNILDDDKACSAVLFVLERLNVVDHIYQFSLHFFLDISDYVLRHKPNLKTVTEYSQRRDILLNDLFRVVHKRTSRALLHRDRVMLAVLLGQVKLRGVEDKADRR